MQTYFDVPTQVAFWDPYLMHYVSGIAYKDKIIGGDNGAAFPIEILKDEENDPDAPVLVIYNHWVNLDPYILDEEEERK